MKRVILISGNCYAGKTYFKNLILKFEGDLSQYWGAAFAAVLKDEMHDAGIIDKNLLSDPEYKERVRPLMQLYGQARRAEDPQYFARKLAEGMVDNACYFVDDWRFLNEARYFEDHPDQYEVVKLRIARGDKQKTESVGREILCKYYAQSMNDVSETELRNKCAEDTDYFDAFIDNNHADETLLRQWESIKNVMQLKFSSRGLGKRFKVKEGR